MTKQKKTTKKQEINEKMFDLTAENTELHLENENLRDTISRMRKRIDELNEQIYCYKSIAAFEAVEAWFRDIDEPEPEQKNDNTITVKGFAPSK